MLPQIRGLYIVSVFYANDLELLPLLEKVKWPRSILHACNIFYGRAQITFCIFPQTASRLEPKVLPGALSDGFGICNCLRVSHEWEAEAKFHWSKKCDKTPFLACSPSNCFRHCVTVSLKILVSFSVQHWNAAFFVSFLKGTQKCRNKLSSIRTSQCREYNYTTHGSASCLLLIRGQKL